jgi:RNA polymerase sigma factor (sigma-70 family)
MPMAEINHEELAALNDARLGDLLRCEGAAAERAIERLIAESQPVIDGILARYTRARAILTPEDAEDVQATIHLRLVLKLRAVASGPHEAIRNFRGYLATLAYNVVNDHLRKRFPERARLKARLRYALSHDPRLAIWQGEDGPLCGLAGWKEHEDYAPSLGSRPPAIDAREAGPALEQIFRAAGMPVLFEDAVDAIAGAWQVVDRDATTLDAVRESSETPGAASRIEDLDFARALWSEIRELPPMQRKALLLNLRYGGESNIVSLLVLGRIARFDEIAEALEMSRAELVSIWRGLPIDDATIAERFGITRQQVINLRKSARARLSRRLGR